MRHEDFIKGVKKNAVKAKVVVAQDAESGPIYDHAYTVAFSVKTPHEAQDVTAEELLDGLADRLKDLEATGEVFEAVGMPYDTAKIEDGFIE